MKNGNYLRDQVSNNRKEKNKGEKEATSTEQVKCLYRRNKMPICDGCKIDRPAKQLKVIDSGDRLCLACIEEIRGNDHSAATSEIEAMETVITSPWRSKEPTCQQCNGSMKKKVLSTGNCSGIMLALIVFFAGVFVFLFFFFTIIGPIIGLLMVLVALGMGGKRRKVWKCTQCDYVFERA